MIQTKAQEKRTAQALEAYLVAVAKTGDTTALSQLVRLTGPRLLGHANALLNDPEVARDCVQSAWIDILRGLPKLREVHAFRAYALKIVTRKVAAEIKVRQHYRALSDEFAQDSDTELPALGDIAADANTVKRAIAALPPAQRMTLALFYLDDLTIPEVAKILNVPIGTIKTRLMHARNKLRATLIGDEDDQT